MNSITTSQVVYSSALPCRTIVQQVVDLDGHEVAGSSAPELINMLRH